jgi:hypothetical protein
MKKNLLYILVLVGALSGALLPAVSWGQNIMLKNGSVTIGAGETAEDIVIAGTTLDISGRVFGTAYALQSDVTLRSGCEIKGEMTVVGGSLTIAKGARIRNRITVSRTVIRTGLPYVLQNDELLFTEDGFKITPMEEPLSQNVTDFMASHLVMSRPVPEGDAPVLFPDLLADGSREQDIGTFRISSLVEFSVRKDIIMRSGRCSVSADDGDVSVTAVEFRMPADADYFWNKVRTIPEARLNHSLHISLAGGAHWYFRHKDSTVILWYRNNWFFCVEVKGGAGWTAKEKIRDQIIDFYEKAYNHHGPKQD